MLGRAGDQDGSGLRREGAMEEPGKKGSAQRLPVKSLGAAVTLKVHWTTQPRWEEATVGLGSCL